MALSIGLILALFSIAVAVYPFLRGRRIMGWRINEEPGFGETEALTGAELANKGVAGDGGADAAELEAIYAAIGSLQLERDLGNIPEGLYREQLDDYRRQAAAALRQQALAQAANPDGALEAEIRSARARLNQDQASLAAEPARETTTMPPQSAPPQSAEPLSPSSPATEPAPSSPSSPPTVHSPSEGEENRREGERG